ncbi:putative ribonuclease H-like domain-containing protein [Tanacetum coccineum]
MHDVPSPMTGNYMPSGPDVEIDYSQFTYGPKQSKPSESETQTSDFDTYESDSSEPTVNKPKVVSQHKVWSDAPIIEEYESDSEDEYVSLPTKEQETPSFANKQVKSPRETVKNQFTHSKNPKVDKKAELNNRMRKKSSQMEIRQIWNNVQRVNHKNQFVPTTVLTRTGKFLVNTARASGTNNVSTARHNLNRQAVPSNGARKVNTVKPIVNNAKANIVKPLVSTFRKLLNRTTTLRTNFSYQKVNTAEDYPHRTLQNKWIVDSGCSRHMTGNKAYLAEYQDFNGGPVAFGGSKGYITGKENIVPSGGLACLIAKATIDESNKWHRRFSWVFFLRTKDETSGILKDFIRQIENQLNQKVKTIRCDNGTEFKNRDFIEFYGSKGIKREYSNVRTPQQNGVADIPMIWLLMFLTASMPDIMLAVVLVLRLIEKTDGNTAFLEIFSHFLNEASFYIAITLKNVPVLLDHFPINALTKGSGGNHGGQSSSDRSLSGNCGGMHSKTRGRLLTSKKLVLDKEEEVSYEIRGGSDKHKKVRLTRNEEGITEAEKKFKQLAGDEEVAIKVQEDWEAEEEVKKLAEEEATKAALSNEYDFIQAIIEADRILAARIQEEEREKFTVEERAKFLHDTIAAQRKFLAQQRSEAIKKLPSTRISYRILMMTFLKNVGNFMHLFRRNKNFRKFITMFVKTKEV